MHSAYRIRLVRFFALFFKTMLKTKIQKNLTKPFYSICTGLRIENRDLINVKFGGNYIKGMARPLVHPYRQYHEGYLLVIKRLLHLEYNIVAKHIVHESIFLKNQLAAEEYGFGILVPDLRDYLVRFLHDFGPY